MSVAQGFAFEVIQPGGSSFSLLFGALDRMNALNLSWPDPLSLNNGLKSGLFFPAMVLSFLDNSCS